MTYVLARSLRNVFQNYKFIEFKCCSLLLISFIYIFIDCHHMVYLQKGHIWCKIIGNVNIIFISYYRTSTGTQSCGARSTLTSWTSCWKLLTRTAKASPTRRSGMRSTLSCLKVPLDSHVLFMSCSTSVEMISSTCFLPFWSLSTET